MWKILFKNILALYRYRDFRVGIFYFASPCINERYPAWSWSHPASYNYNSWYKLYRTPCILVMGAHARASPTYSLDAVESCFLPHDAMHSADYAVTRCLSVRPSVAARYFIETARYVIILFSLSASHTILVFPYQTV